ncbi:hypothetical protein [Novipirellula sp.]|uniref:hypothetical protein n=1 Tax=Novipirellula sp. TaxID=2795430 RepID=UPI0035620F23
MKKKQTELSAANLSEMRIAALQDAELLDPFIAAFLGSWDPTKSLSPEDWESIDVVMEAMAVAKQALKAATHEATVAGKPVSNAILRRILRPVVAALKVVAPNLSVEQKRTRLIDNSKLPINAGSAFGTNHPVEACNRVFKFFESSETYLKGVKSEEFDKASERVIGSPDSTDTEEMRQSETTSTQSETAPSIEAVIEHARIHGLASLTLNDIRVMKEYVLKREVALTKQGITERFNTACKIIDDLRPGEVVTAKRLTEFFAKKHEAAKTHLKRTEGEVLPDEKKRELIELVDAFRATGGIVRLDGEACTMDLDKPKSMKQHRFKVRTTDSQRTDLWSNIKVPLLTFSNP